MVSNLGYFGHNEKQFKPEEKTKLVRQDAKILKAEPNVNFKDFSRRYEKESLQNNPFSGINSKY